MSSNSKCRFPPRHRTNGKGKDGRGIGSHTDYGLLVLAAQDEVGGEKLLHRQLRRVWRLTGLGLFVRPPQQGERFNNWQQSAAGAKEDESGWVYVPPVPSVFTVFPGKQPHSPSAPPNVCKVSR